LYEFVSDVVPGFIAVIEESSVVCDVLIARNYHPLKPVRRGQAQNDHHHRCKRADDGCDNLDHDFTLVFEDRRME